MLFLQRTINFYKENHGVQWQTVPVIRIAFQIFEIEGRPISRKQVVSIPPYRLSPLTVHRSDEHRETEKKYRLFLFSRRRKLLMNAAAERQKSKTQRNGKIYSPIANSPNPVCNEPNQQIGRVRVAPNWGENFAQAQPAAGRSTPREGTISVDLPQKQHRRCAQWRHCRVPRQRITARIQRLVAQKN